VNLHVGPLQVPIVEKNMSLDEAWGEFWCLPAPKIYINKDLPRDVKALTILHEVLECITEIYGLNLSEGTIRTLEMSLATLVKENPKELQEWVGMLESGSEESNMQFPSDSGESGTGLGALGCSGAV